MNSHYGANHNYGGTISPTIPITLKNEKILLAKFYEIGQVSWKAMALTKKKELKPVIQISARPYITLTNEDLEEILSVLYSFNT